MQMVQNSFNPLNTCEAKCLAKGNRLKGCLRLLSLIIVVINVSKVYSLYTPSIEADKQ